MEQGSVMKQFLGISIGICLPLIGGIVFLFAVASRAFHCQDCNLCAVCHGSSGGHPSFIAKGLFPKPPQLLEIDDQITADPVGEAYWKVKNGIRLTGMPGFVDSCPIL